MVARPPAQSLRSRTPQRRLQPRKSLGLSLAAVGALVALSRLTDVVTDPLIGMLVLMPILTVLALALVPEPQVKKRAPVRFAG